MQEKIKRIDSEMGSSSADNIGEDAVTQVLGKDKPERIRGMGARGYCNQIGILTC